MGASNARLQAPSLCWQAAWVRSMRPEHLPRAQGASKMMARSAVQGCSCDATVIEGGKRNGIKENAIRISASHTVPPFTAVPASHSADEGLCLFSPAQALVPIAIAMQTGIALTCTSIMQLPGPLYSPDAPVPNLAERSVTEAARQFRRRSLLKVWMN